MTTLKSYTDEVKDTIIDALKANLKGVTVLTSAVENEEDEILDENNSNQPCENSISSGQKNKDNNLCEPVNEDYTTSIVDKDGDAVDVDDILPLAIVDEDLVAVDEYFVKEVNEQEEEKMAEKDEEREEEKLEEKEEEIEEKLEEEQIEENKEEEHIEEKEEEQKEEEKIEENKEQEKEEEQIELQEEEKKHKKLEEKVDEGSDENSVDMMGIVRELNGELNGDEIGFLRQLIFEVGRRLRQLDHAFLVWIYEVFPHLGNYAKKSLDSPLSIFRLLRWHTTKSDNIVDGDPFKNKGRSTKVVHPYLVPTVRVTVLTSAVENEEDEILDENNSNQPCENSISSGQKNKDNNLCERVASLELSMIEQLMKTTSIVDKDGDAVDVDDILPLAIVDEDLVAVDEYFVKEVNEQEEEKMAEKDEEREEEKLEEKKEEIEEKLEEEQIEENKEEEHIEEKEEEQKEEEKIEENKEQEKEEEQIELQEEEKKHKKLEEKVDEGSDENSVDMMGIVRELNGELNGDEIGFLSWFKTIDF
ncbi:hypothetical protein KY290_038253 [Solanum tuberosum]|uniref:Uncharacterized protein n=1 Tax=Solanum tuberosum TaxID=4113 RepID=A0ABQ7TZS5_SOLTU|nr:hypothetical protein KY289_035525 [Solanum tuberosum]KAH0739548.1 hypothetical protein KY290_038253 [Solanum tuberosum]